MRTASCQINLKQIALSIQMYIADFGRRLPSTNSSGELLQAVQPYLRNRSIRCCPSDKSLRRTQAEAAKHSILGRNYTSYEWNKQLAGYRLDTIKHPEHTIILYDRRPWHLGGRNIAFLNSHVE